MYGNLNQNHSKYKISITNHLVVIVICIFKLQEFILMVFMYVNINTYD